MKVVIGIAAALVLLTGALVWTHFKDKFSGKGAKSITVFCAAGIKKPVAAAAEQYRKEYGVEVQLQYGGTGTLLSQIQIAKRGDLFIAADETAVEAAREAGTVVEVLPLCNQYPVIAVRAGNPKGVKTFEDLFRKDLRVAVANPEAASIGKATKATAGERWAELEEKVTVMKPTVTELAADLSLGSIDVAIVWNSTVPQFKGIEAVEVPEFAKRVDKVTVSVLKASKHPASALKFARYLNAPGKGAKIFRENGFDAIEGDTWAPKPELILYSGGVNRPAVEKTLAEFAHREGVTVTTIFNGCGVLCATMQAMNDASNPKFPDAYYACDLCFVPPVAEAFPEAFLLTETIIGISVQNGNPKNVKTLADLAQPGLKVGICNAEQSTLGFMTQGMLRSSALENAVRRNVVVEVPTADFLINQMRAGALDAVIVYEVNYQLQKEYLEFFPIDHEGARAVQPFSVHVNSERKQLAGRLLAFLRKNRKRFEETGFTWLGDQPAVKSTDLEIPAWLKKPAEK